jgi:hypothetical protein
MQQRLSSPQRQEKGWEASASGLVHFRFGQRRGSPVFGPRTPTCIPQIDVSAGTVRYCRQSGLTYRRWMARRASVRGLEEFFFSSLFHLGVSQLTIT